MADYPQMIVPVDHVEPVPRRVRAYLGGVLVVDTVDARYLWEWPPYPQYYIPLDDVLPAALVPADRTEQKSRGLARRYGLQAGGRTHPDAGWAYGDDALAGIAGTIRFDWTALDTWFEEDEQVFVHPRNPYARVDALRSSRTVKVELDGVLLAESSSTVMVFETGLPTRYYFDRTAVRFEVLESSQTTTSCPYKGNTSAYWSVRTPTGTHPDLAWSYDFPARQLLPITGLVAFYNEKVDVTIDGRPLERPKTHMG